MADKRPLRRRKQMWILAFLIGAFLVSGCQKETDWKPIDPDAASTQPVESGQMGGDIQTDPAVTVPVPESTVPPQPELSFPYELESGALEIASMFQYTGISPDSGWQEALDIGTIEITNRSNRYLQSASLTATLSDGSTLDFQLADLPPGATAWVFAQENGYFSVDAYCVSIGGQAQFSDDLGLSADQVRTESQGMVLTLYNETSEDLQGLSARCHILFDGVYFGGTSYAYPVADLPAGGSAEIMASDCFLGDAAVAWIGPAA